MSAGTLVRTHTRLCPRCRLQVNIAGQFDFSFPLPGARAREDPWPHISIECTGCNATVTNKWYPQHSNITAYDSNPYCAAAAEIAPAKTYAQPDGSNSIHAVPHGQKAEQLFYVIMQEHWRAPAPDDPDAACWAQEHGNPCPAFQAEQKCRNDLTQTGPTLPAAGACLVQLATERCLYMCAGSRNWCGNRRD